MFGYSDLATIHAAAGVIAIASGFISLLWHRDISLRSAWGRLYTLAAIVLCLTSSTIYWTGAFHPAHALAIAILVLLRIGTAGGSRSFGPASPYVETLAFSTSFLLLTVAALVETAIRLSLGAFVLANWQHPTVAKAGAVSLALLTLVMALQMIAVYRRSRGQRMPEKTPTTSAGTGTPEAPPLSSPTLAP